MKCRVRLPGVALGMVLGSWLAAHEGIHEQRSDVTRRLASTTDPAKKAALLVRRGILRRIHREWQAAARDFRRVRELDPTLEVVNLQLGILWFDAGKPARARRHLDEFLEAHPENVKGLVTRARMLTTLGEHLSAAADYGRAIARFDELGGQGPSKAPLPEYYLGRARSLAAAGAKHVGEAIGTLDEGLARLGPVVTLELAALEIEVANARYDKALARLDRLVSRATRKERWHARRGEILEKAGRTADAAEAYRDALLAIEALPPSHRLRRHLAQLKMRLRAASERLERCNKASRSREGLEE